MTAVTNSAPQYLLGSLPRILIILHQHNSSSGKLGQMLRAKGFDLDIRRPRYGEPLPETMDDHAGAVIFGGPMSANDPDDFIKREIDWIGVPLAEKAPFLGLCLGAQMLAKHMGAAVTAHPQGCVEVGFYDLQSTDAGDRLTHWPQTVYQWHREGFELPADSQLLATSEMFENQAFSVGDTAYGIQFHSELTYAMACRWSVKGEERTHLPGAQQRPAHLSGWVRHDPAVRQWLDGFIDLWTAGDRRSCSRAA